MTGTPPRSPRLAANDNVASGSSTPLYAPQPTLPNIPPRVGSPLSEMRRDTPSPSSGAAAMQRTASIGQVTEDEVAANLRRQWRRQRAALAGDDTHGDESRPDSAAPIEDSEVPTPSNPADLDSVPISDEQKARIIDRQ